MTPVLPTMRPATRFTARKADSGKTEDALATVRHFTARPSAPAYFHYLEAEAWAAKQDWERAWQSWQDYKLASKD